MSMNGLSDLGSVNFGLEVIDYAISGDPIYCESHKFVIRIWMNQHMYVINRSYASFCIFHSSIKRKYPKSAIPSLPLAAQEKYSFRTPLSPKKKNSNKEDKALDESRISLASEQQKNSMSNLNDDESVDNQKNNVEFETKDDLKSKYNTLHRVDPSEVISQKKSPLSRYLNALLQLVEIVSSTNLMCFLDEESDIGLNNDSGAVDDNQPSEESILLQGETYSVKTVGNTFVIPFNVDAGNVVVWQFKTQSYDIAFSLIFNDQEVLPYQRYNSHLGLIRGSLIFKGSGKVSMTFDNSYSIMRSKRLSYIIKVFNSSEYEAARALFNEYTRDKQKYVHQRQLLNKVLVSQSKATILSRQSDLSRFSLHMPELMASSGLEGQMIEQDKISDEVTRLENEKRSLQMAMQHNETALIEERSVLGDYIEKLDNMTGAKENLEAEVKELKACIENIKTSYEGDIQRLIISNSELISNFEDSQEKLSAAKAEISRLKSLTDERMGVNMLTSREGFITESGNSFDIASIPASETEKNLREDLFKMDQVNIKLKAEKKQLKVYALQQKTEIEALKIELEESRRNNQALQSTWNDLMMQRLAGQDGGDVTRSALEKSAPVAIDSSNASNHVAADPGSSTISQSGVMKLFFAEDPVEESSIPGDSNMHFNNSKSDKDSTTLSSFLSKLTTSPLKESALSSSNSGSMENLASFAYSGEDKIKDRPVIVEAGSDTDSNSLASSLSTSIVSSVKNMMHFIGPSSDGKDVLVSSGGHTNNGAGAAVSSSSSVLSTNSNFGTSTDTSTDDPVSLSSTNNSISSSSISSSSSSNSSSNSNSSSSTHSNDSSNNSHNNSNSGRRASTMGQSTDGGGTSAAMPIPSTSLNTNHSSSSSSSSSATSSSSVPSNKPVRRGSTMSQSSDGSRKSNANLKFGF